MHGVIVMIPVSEVIAEIREAENDIDEVKYSDYDLLSAINKTIRLMSNQLALMNSPFTEGAVDYPASDVLVGADLPDDYMTLRKVVSSETGYNMSPTNNTIVATKSYSGRYFISNNKLYAGTGVQLLYRRKLPKVGIADSIDVPDFLLDFITSVSRLVLTNAAKDVLTEQIANLAKLIIPQRKYGNVKLGMQFRV